ncbi:MAG: acyl-[acyl-carrier-protein]--UDP-N-acetylglucosamine O-acyltransferase, partial [Bacteroidales bacterium]|nr:acyl-[acyl-carrier-protein]--UDP-N-acetylglucosamine O-acyltransferase [Bacteroidales bacterium]
PYITAGREPLSFAGLNAVGLKRRGFSNDKINEIQELYRTLYQSGMNITDAVEHIKANSLASTERDTVLNFIANSSRGIIRG